VSATSVDRRLSVSAAASSTASSTSDELAFLRLADRPRVARQLLNRRGDLIIIQNCNRFYVRIIELIEVRRNEACVAKIVEAVRVLVERRLIGEKIRHGDHDRRRSRLDIDGRVSEALNRPS
jgi:hypothetical protein